jgi:metal-responsive CopG/Arc/MetJ family transcriptional regulator
MTVYRLSASQLDTIDRIRSHTHESRSSLIRRLLQEALDRYEGRVG